jgi:NAD-dependent oxidoreductase involved in siderophore biosynthesis
MVIKATYIEEDLRDHTPNVVVVDPQFDAYRDLAASARAGRIGLHLRASGSEAMRLARRLDVDAWLVAEELDDMAGADFVDLLATIRGESKVAMIGSATDPVMAESDVDMVLSDPITFADLEDLLGLPAAERSRKLFGRGITGSWAALPVSVGAAVVAIAVLMVG